jgi:hypothetical protein
MLNYVVKVAHIGLTLLYFGIMWPKLMIMRMAEILSNITTKVPPLGGDKKGEEVRKPAILFLEGILLKKEL